MSLSRHAYRHAIQSSSSTSFIDHHVWIGEDFLASTFRRFVVNGQQQRRYESRVPGPMEARRRLAKRRNTALASFAGTGPLDDMPCLFGRNGREHMKWTDGRRRAPGEVQGSGFQPLGPPDVPAPVYDNSNSGDFDNLGFEDLSIAEHDARDNGSTLTDFQSLSGGFEENMTSDNAEDLSGPKDYNNARDKFLTDYLQKHWRVTAIKDVVRLLDIDLRQEPAYSRLIFDHLLAHSVQTKGALNELVVFLDDPFMNTQGAGNYSLAVRHLTRHEASAEKQRVILTAVTRALELGLIPPDELCTIVKTVPQIQGGEKVTWDRDRIFLTGYFREMWNAIGRCDVLGPKDLNKDTVDAWLGVLEEANFHKAVLLAKDIILETQDPSEDRCSWVRKFIARWLDFSVNKGFRVKGDYARQLLNHFNPDAASRYIYRTTETLASLRDGGQRRLLLEAWRDCLSKFQEQEVSALATSKAWYNVPPPRDMELGYMWFTSKTPSKSPRHHQIILRLWALRTLSIALPEGPLWRDDERATDLPILKLFELYEDLTAGITLGDSLDAGICIHKCLAKPEEDLLPSLLKGIRDLEIPYNGLMILAVDLKTRHSLRKRTRATLRALETGADFSTLFLDPHAYNSTMSLLFSSFETMVKQIDVTDSSFIEQSVYYARNGDTRSAWALIRLFRAHTPLKVALSKAWLPDPSENDTANANALVLSQNTPRTADTPDPLVALEMIHLLAIAFSDAKNLSPRRSYSLVYWLYNFLTQHHAPVKPSMVRAMYHAGVVRFRRAGMRVARTQYDFIIEVVKEFETPEARDALLESPRVGEKQVW
ncbi:hypothetical protein AWENTII_011370 [Aspergillus wentii]|nr:hypothetical protein MW887_003836 [Aspergillus wentii]